MDTCSICFDTSFSNTETDKFRLFITQCNHKFHYSCIYRWALINNSCPTCRQPNIFSNISNISNIDTFDNDFDLIYYQPNNLIYPILQNNYDFDNLYNIDIIFNNFINNYFLLNNISTINNNIDNNNIHNNNNNIDFYRISLTPNRRNRYNTFNWSNNIFRPNTPSYNNLNTRLNNTNNLRRMNFF